MLNRRGFLGRFAAMVASLAVVPVARAFAKPEQATLVTINEARAASGLADLPPPMVWAKVELYRELDPAEFTFGGPSSSEQVFSDLVFINRLSSPWVDYSFDELRCGDKFRLNGKESCIALGDAYPIGDQGNYGIACDPWCAPLSEIEIPCSVEDHHKVGCINGGVYVAGGFTFPPEMLLFKSIKGEKESNDCCPRMRYTATLVVAPSTHGWNCVRRQGGWARVTPNIYLPWQERLTSEQRATLMEEFRKVYYGPSQGDPIVLDGILSDCQRITNRVLEMDYLLPLQ
jgi:hypothetical protein